MAGRADRMNKTWLTVTNTVLPMLVRPERVVCDRLGWPVTRFKGRPVQTCIRYLLHGRSIAKWWRVKDGGLYSPGQIEAVGNGNARFVFPPDGSLTTRGSP